MAEPKIEVKELRPELADDYFRLFDRAYDEDPWLNYRSNPWWGGCYCGFYDDMREEDEINALADKRTENKRLRRERIEDAKASGLLAYSGQEVVGWCNVAPRGSYVNLRYLKDGIADPAERVGAITCFLVDSRHRGSGVASRLLQAACDLVRGWGLTVAEGYPRNPGPAAQGTESTPNSNADFRGSMGMYLRAGFRVHLKLEKYTVVRKPV